MTKTTSYLIGLAMIAGLATTASATPIATGTYQLHNHPDGNARPPGYGLRLDGIIGGNSSTVTLDFDDTANGAAMFLDYDGSTMHIYGHAYGGVDNGTSHDNPVLWSIDYRMTDNVERVAADTGGIEDIRIFDDSTANGGRISSSHGDWYLTDYTGHHDYSFRLGDGDSGSGHRGFAGISGWGWVNHWPVNYNGNVTHIAASDWLFTMESLPMSEAPVTMLFAAGLLGLAFARRHRPNC